MDKIHEANRSVCRSVCLSDGWGDGCSQSVCLPSVVDPLGPVSQGKSVCRSICISFPFPLSLYRLPWCVGAGGPLHGVMFSFPCRLARVLCSVTRLSSFWRESKCVKRVKCGSERPFIHPSINRLVWHHSQPIDHLVSQSARLLVCLSVCLAHTYSSQAPPSDKQPAKPLSLPVSMCVRLYCLCLSVGVGGLQPSTHARQTDRFNQGGGGVECVCSVCVCVHTVLHGCLSVCLSVAKWLGGSDVCAQ